MSQYQNKLRTLVGASLVAAGLASGSAFAAVVIDDEGTGFIGKGDVQLALNWNNKQLQDCVGTGTGSGCLEFRMNSEQVTTWTCTKDNGNTQERAHTVTMGGLVAATARVKNQVTGFNVLGFTDENAVTETHDGPSIGTCPTNWDASDISTQNIGGSGIEVRANGGAWMKIE